MTFILTGMHRSGTSMFARFLHESGINMGTDFYVDTTSNKYGHYEDLDFLNLQRQELARQFNGEDYLVYKAFPLSLDFVKKSKQLYREKTDHNSGKSWGWKDPRTTVFLHHWHSLDRDARFIFMVRKPDDVVNSLCRLLKTKWSLKQKSKYLKTYIFYNQQLLAFIRKHNMKNMAVIGFEKLMDDPENILCKAGEQIGHEFDTALFKKLFDDKALSAPQGISYFFLRKKLSEAQKVYNQLSTYF